jgi:hypothetical protein
MRNRLVTAAGVMALLAATTTMAAAQVAPDPVDFRPFADGRNWIVKQPLKYRVGISHDSVIVPVGFVTDLASIPPALQSIIQQNGPYLLPAVVHDYLYWMQTCTRNQSDRILLLAMVENDVGKFDRDAIYGAVRAAGSFAWAANARDRARKLPRVLPADRLQIRAKTLWPEYQRQLVRDNVAPGPEIAIAAAFCARGSMSLKDALEKP